MTVREFLDVPRAREAAAVFLLGSALLVTLALGSYSALDPSFFAASGHPASNWVGPVGAQVAALLYETTGLASWFLPLILIASALRRLKMTTSRWRRSAIAGLTLVAVSTAVLLTLLVGVIQLRGATLHAGGACGRLIADLSIACFGEIGSLVLMATTLLAGMALAARSSLAESTADAARVGGRVPKALWGVLGASAGWRQWSQRAAVVLRWRPWRRSAAAAPEIVAAETRSRRGRRGVAEATGEPGAGTAHVPEPAGRTAPRLHEPATVEPRPRPVAPPVTHRGDDQARLPVELPAPSASTRLPPTTLLSPAAEKATVNRQELLAIARQIESRCARCSRPICSAVLANS
jgi:hypothetical protein